PRPPAGSRDASGAGGTGGRCGGHRRRCRACRRPLRPMTPPPIGTVAPMTRRSRMSVALLTVVVVGLTSCRSSAPSAGALPLRTVAELALPGSASRFDYQDIDPTTNRLFIAHLGASQIDVVDLTTTTVVATIPDITSVHGVRVAPDLGRLYA